MSCTTMTKAEWMAEGARRFGDDFEAWRFTCPVCHHVATVADFRQHKDAGATPNSATNECIGRYRTERAENLGRRGASKQPCDYAGYGLFRLSPVHVQDGDRLVHCFAFADAAPAAVAP